MTIGDALQRLERALVHDGGRALRELVLEGEASQVAWPEDLPPLPDDAHVWLGWRQPQDYAFIDVSAAATSTLLSAERAAELTRELQSELPGYIALLGDTPHYACDTRGAVVTVTYDENGARVAAATNLDLAGLVEQIAETYAAHRESSLRSVRVAPDADAHWRAVSAADLFEDVTVGSAVAWSVQHGRRRRSWIAVRLEEHWLSAMLTVWNDALDVEDACAALRCALGAGGISCFSTPELRAEIERVCSAKRSEPHHLLRGRVHVWREPSMQELLARLAATREQIPLRFRPGASDAELRTLGDVPDDLRALYAFANGSESALYFRYQLAPIASALETSRIMCELARVQFGAEYWDARCIPLLDKGNGDNLYVDVAGAYGPPGCVIDFDHERPERREVLFDSVAQWLEQLVEGIEQGEYEWADEGVFPTGFFDDGDLYAIKRFAKIYTNEAYPWTRRLRLTDRG